MLRLSLLLAVAIVPFVAAYYPAPNHRFEKDVQPLQADHIEYRLPNNTVPISYNLELTTNVDKEDFSFTGKVEIRLRAVINSRSITIHHRQLTIDSYSLRLANDNTGAPIQLIPVVYNDRTELLTFNLGTNLELVANTEYILTVNYHGTLREDNAGFYRSSYISASGSRVWMATTQFEWTDARHGFPCYDEPSFRATYTIAITHGSSYHALSNTPVVSVVPSADGLTHKTTFAETPAPTPSYLIAFIVSDFAYIEDKSPKVPQRVYARPNAIQNGHFGLDTGVKVLTSLEKYFGIEFTFPKMDQVAIPDFWPGAMENWGLVTYRESALLFSDAENTFINKRGIATIIAHEYAHQWFGNLVTPKWWNYLWLNEGFATLFENYATDWVFPEWKILDTFVFSVLQNEFIADSLPSTHPMTYYVQTPNEIRDILSHISYPKSGSVLRMMLHALTEASFKKGLITYLNEKANSDATEEDLFAHLERAVRQDNSLNSNYNVATIFSSWTRQAGFPIVTVERTYNTGTINLAQERYLSVPETTQSPSLWWIPFNYASASSANFNDTTASNWLSTRTSSFVESNLKAEDWFLLNKRQTGYYRVKYDLQNYKLLSAALISNKDQIHLTSRSQLIDDAFDFARTERQGYDVAFDIIKYLEHEVEYVPWASAFRGLELVDRLYSSSENYAKYATYLQKLLAHLYGDAGLTAKTNEHHYRKQARNQAIRWACHYGSTACLNETKEAAENYLIRNVAVHQDHRAFVLCSGIRNANAAVYQALINKLVSETDQTERNRFLDALACHSDLVVIKTLLESTITTDNAFKTVAERYRVLSEVAGINTANTKLTLEFLLANVDEIFRLYEQNTFNSAIIRLSTLVNSAALIQQFNEIVNVASPKSYISAATINTARNNVAYNEKWINRNTPVIDEWIRTNGSSTLMVSSLLIIALTFVLQFFRM